MKDEPRRAGVEAVANRAEIRQIELRAGQADDLRAGSVMRRSLDEIIAQESARAGDPNELFHRCLRGIGRCQSDQSLAFFQDSIRV